MRKIDTNIAQVNLEKLKVQHSNLEKRYESLRVEMLDVARKLNDKHDQIQVLEAKLAVALEVVSGGIAA